MNEDAFVSALHHSIEEFMHHSMNNFLIFAKTSGLTMPQIGALFQIQHRGASGVSHIGARLGITSAGASQMMERLVQQGLVERSEDPEDRRGKKLELTPKGKRTVEASIRARQNWVEELSELMTDPEKQQVMMALKLLDEKIQKLDKKTKS